MGKPFMAVMSGEYLRKGRQKLQKDSLQMDLQWYTDSQAMHVWLPEGKREYPAVIRVTVK